MRNPNDSAGGRENDFLSAHDKLLAGLNSPAFAVLNISAADFGYLGRGRYFPSVDNRPLRVAGQPEKREYYAILVNHDQPYGNPSASITITVSA